MAQNEAILKSILHQKGSQDVFRVGRFLSTILGDPSKKV
jgi:hypothetical protein